MENGFRIGAGYIRVSTDKQEELSPAAQKRMLTDYAKNNHIIITEWYQDDGISGRQAKKRPQFQEMIASAKSTEHPYDCILVWKFSRFARNQEESILYKSLLQRNNVDVISITETMDDSPFSSLIERIIEWMDEYYSIRLSGEVHRGMTEKALRGGYMAATPLGYRMNKETHIPEIYEPESVIVEKIFKLCLDGYNLTTITRMINDEGYLTRRGNRFELRTVYYILSNPYYAGMVRWNRAKHGNYFLNDESQIIIKKGKHESLVTQDDFNRVQALIEKHKPGITGMHHRKKSDTEYKHYLCGIIKCPICGANFAYSSSATNYPYFNCYKYAKGMHRNGGNINAKRCENALLQSLSSIVDTDADEIDFHYRNEKQKPDSSRLDRYRKSFDKLADKEKRIRDAYIDGIDTKEEYRENKERIQNEKRELQKLIAQEEQMLSGGKIIQSPAEYIQMVADLIALLNNPDAGTLEKHKALESVLEKMTYDRERDTFEFTYRYS